MNNKPSYFRDHSRHWSEMSYVYPVISRRSGGLSIGINLNLDGVCNFDCVYCQVLDRKGRAPRPVVVDELLAELEVMLDAVSSGAIWEDERFREVPAERRVIRDIAFSGDGEPTACRSFAEAVRGVCGLKKRRGLEGVRLIVLTNATLLDRPAVREGLEALCEAGGLLWAKLDAGRQVDYERIDRSAVPLSRVVENIATAPLPVVIQTMLCRLEGEAMSEAGFTAYMDRVEEIVERHGRVEAIHLYTVARATMEAGVEPISAEALERRAEQLRASLGERAAVQVFA